MAKRPKSLATDRLPFHGFTGVSGMEHENHFSILVLLPAMGSKKRLHGPAAFLADFSKSSYNRYVLLFNKFRKIC